MASTMIEKILASHSKHNVLKPGEIVDLFIDIRAARDFGGANVIKNLKDHNLDIADPLRTLFTFDCNPTGSDQKYAVNQHLCRLFARENGIKVFDINSGIGTHLLIDEGYVVPGSTAVSTDSHANILGAAGAFGQGMGDMDIAAAWNKGKVWFKVPESVKITLTGSLQSGISPKDVVLNLLNIFGPNTLLGYAAEIYGDLTDTFSLDDRITISSMATEMGAIIIFFPPSEEIVSYCRKRTLTSFQPVFADKDAEYAKEFEIDVTGFKTLVARPGAPHDTIDVSAVAGTKIDSVFIGSCTNGRMSDMRKTASLLQNRKVAPGVVLKIVPATDDIWKSCLQEGLINIFKEAGALVSNAGCGGCAAGQVGQNGQGEITISTGNRNFPGKQGKGEVYLASPEVAASSAVAGFITTQANIPEKPAEFISGRRERKNNAVITDKTDILKRPMTIIGRAWKINRDNIDTDMIYHNRYLAVTELKEMGKYTFDNLHGFEDFSEKASEGDIVFTGRNFGCGSSRQQAVDCFIALGVQAIVAASFGAIYERNAINAAFPVIICNSDELELNNGDNVKIDFCSGKIENLSNGKSVFSKPFSEVQMDIYMNGGLL